MSEVTGKELGWDDNISKDSSFIELPPGDYEFSIDHYERGRSKGEGKLPACNMAIVFFNVKSPEGVEVQIKENYILHEMLEWKLSELFTGVGLKEKGEQIRMNWNALPGLTGKAEVSLDPGTKNPDQKFNHIKKIYPKEKKKFTAGSF